MIVPFVIVSLVLSILYFILIGAFTFGWLRQPLIRASVDIEQHKKFSILIPFRNEENNLSVLLKSLSALSYPEDCYELILVNDQSRDNSVAIINEFMNNSPLQLSLINSEGGKKQAITKGLKQAKNDYILSVDADCKIPVNILHAYNTLLQKKDYKLVGGPVSFYGSTNFFGQMLELEFMSLVASGAGSILIHKPIMLNAANMLIKTTVAREAEEEVYRQKVSSGDDIFLLHYIVKNYGTKAVSFLKAKEAIVETKVPASISEWLWQRLRWTSKARYYEINFTSITALIILAFNVLILASIPLLFIHSALQFIGVYLLLFKIIVDYMILLPSAKFFAKKHLLIFVPLLNVIYPFYIVIIGIGGLLFTIGWKK